MTAATNAAVITTNAPTKKIDPITAVSTTATLWPRLDLATSPPPSTDWKGRMGTVRRIVLFATIASAALPW